MIGISPTLIVMMPVRGMNPSGGEGVSCGSDDAATVDIMTHSTLDIPGEFTMGDYPFE